VTALCRRPADLADLQASNLAIAAGDLRDLASYAARLPAGGTVFHLAGVRGHLRHPGAWAAEMAAVNVAATLALARAAGEEGVARFVHVATALIYGAAFDGRARSEQDPLAPGSSLYARSKAAAVEGIRALARAGLPAVTVCPTLVFGPDHPSHPNRITSEIRRLLRGGPRIWLAGGRQLRNLVYVDDVVGGLLAAEARGRLREEYLLGGEEISPRALGERVRALAAERGVTTSGIALSLPAGAARAAGIADRLRGHEAGGGYATAVENLLAEWRFDSGKAARELGYRPLPFAAGLERTIDFLLTDGLHLMPERIEGR
jgi:dihydroflavonol-4-reductase